MPAEIFSTKCPAGFSGRSLKSPPTKIQSPCLEELLKIEPLVAPEPTSVPPPGSLAMATESYAVPNSGNISSPEVRDATSVAASLTAWDGYPAARNLPTEPKPGVIIIKEQQLIDLGHSVTLIDSGPISPKGPLGACAVVAPLPPRGGKRFSGYEPPFEEHPQLNRAAYPFSTGAQDILFPSSHGVIRKAMEECSTSGGCYYARFLESSF